MARTALTVTDTPAPYGDAMSQLTFAATDAVNGNEFASTGKEIIVAQNTDAAPHDLTIQSSPDPYGREDDLVQTIGAGEFYISPLIPVTGFRQGDGKVYVDSADATIEVVVLKINE